MHATTARRVLGMLAALAALLAVPTAAFAYAPTDADFITCVPGEDQDVECVAGVFEENCPVGFEATVIADGEVVATGTATATADGEVEFDFTVPQDLGDDVEVVVRCEEGEPKVLQDVIANTDGGDGIGGDGIGSDGIAGAGFDSMTVLGIGVLALALGIGALAVSRHRRNSSGA